MVTHVRIEIQATISDRTHEVDSATRAVGLVPQFEIGWTGGRAQPAMDTIEKQLVINPHVVRRFGGRYGQRFWSWRSRGSHSFRLAIAERKFIPKMTASDIPSNLAQKTQRREALLGAFASLREMVFVLLILTEPSGIEELMRIEFLANGSHQPGIPTRNAPNRQLPFPFNRATQQNDVPGHRPGM